MLGQFEETIDDMNVALRLKLNDAVAHYHRGVAYAQLEHPHRAIKDFDKAIRLKPDNFAPAYSQRGAAYADVGQFQRAIRDSDEAIRQDPQDEVVFASRAYIHTLMGDKAEAQRDGDRAIQLGIEPEALKRSLAGINNQPPGKEKGLEGHGESDEEWWKTTGDRIRSLYMAFLSHRCRCHPRRQKCLLHNRW